MLIHSSDSIKAEQKGNISRGSGNGLVKHDFKSHLPHYNNQYQYNTKMIWCSNEVVWCSNHHCAIFVPIGI